MKDEIEKLEEKAKEEIQKSLDEYFDKTKEYCLNKVLEHVDDNEQTSPL